MFTGIVERMGRVTALSPSPSGATLLVHADGWPPDARAGESIAVDGCCLTLVAVGGEHGASTGALRFDVVPQTLSLTTLGTLTPDRTVNLERSATLGTLLGGHLVQGHVDGIGRVRRIECGGSEHRVCIEAPAAVSAFLVERGSIAVNGVSLTIARGGGDGDFQVALIPETRSRTNLGSLREGDAVNLEADAMAKLVDAAVRRHLGR